MVKCRRSCDEEVAVSVHQATRCTFGADLAYLPCYCTRLWSQTFSSSRTATQSWSYSSFPLRVPLRRCQVPLQLVTAGFGDRETISGRICQLPRQATCSQQPVHRSRCFPLHTHLPFRRRSRHPDSLLSLERSNNVRLAYSRQSVHRVPGLLEWIRQVDLLQEYRRKTGRRWRSAPRMAPRGMVSTLSEGDLPHLVYVGRRACWYAGLGTR